MGVDLGGTRIRAGAVTVGGQLLSKSEYLTEARRGPDAVIATVQQAVIELRASVDEVGGIGVACAGQIHSVTGVVVQAPNLGWRDVPLAARLGEAFGAPVIVENDVRAAAWGEFRCGAGQGVSTLLAVFVGTGVGSGAVLQGELWRGASNGAGEIGHTQVVADGRPCPCGQRGCLEQYTSGSGFQRRLRDAIASGRTTRLTDLTRRDPARLTAAMVAAAADDGDDLAREIWSDATRYLKLALANYVTVINPDALILGGGVVETVPMLFSAVAPAVAELTTVLARGVLKIERARLGDWSGVIGAAALAGHR